MFSSLFTFRGQVAAILVVSLGISSWGCSKQDEISTYEEPETSTSKSGQNTTARPATMPRAPEKPVCETPEGWSPGQVGGMRKAAYVVEKGDKKVEITVIDLAAMAGALLAGTVEGVGEGLAGKNVTNYYGWGGVSSVVDGDLWEYAAGRGIANAAGEWSNYIRDRADLMVPHVKVLSGRSATAWLILMTSETVRTLAWARTSKTRASISRAVITWDGA